MYAVLARALHTQTLYVALVSGEQAEILHDYLANDVAHSNSMLLEEVPTVNLKMPSFGQFDALFWTRSTIRLDRLSRPRWNPNKSMMPPIPSTYRSAAITVKSKPIFDCVDFTNRYVPVLREQAHQPAECHTYMMPCDIFKLATMHPRSRTYRSSFNVVVTQRIDEDDGDQDDQDPPRPGPSHHGPRHGLPPPAAAPGQ